MIATSVQIENLRGALLFMGIFGGGIGAMWLYYRHKNCGR